MVHNNIIFTSFLPVGGKENASTFPEKGVSNDNGNQEQPIVSPHKVLQDCFMVSWIILIVIFIVLFIFWMRSANDISKETARCIANNSQVIISKTCSACASQKHILGEYENYFEIIEITEHPEIVQQWNINKVPTWIIKNKTYSGTKSWEELRNLTGC